MRTIRSRCTFIRSCPRERLCRAVVGFALGVLLIVGTYLADAASARVHPTHATMPACALSDSCDDQDPYLSGCRSANGTIMARRAWTRQQDGQTLMETGLLWSPACRAWWAETSVRTRHPGAVFIATWVRICSGGGTCWKEQARERASILWTRMLIAHPGTASACGSPDVLPDHRAESCIPALTVPDALKRPTQGM